MTRVALFLSISTAALMTGAANAQDAAPAGSSADTGDVVRVIGSPIRDSQAASIAQKRNADNIIDVIAADTIGRFPDQNAADALGRLPGLAIQRDQGQARYINFRGMPERWTTVAFDGIEVLGAEGGRVPRFDSIPTVIVGSIEAIKTLTPSLSAEAVAGTININTFNPFSIEGFGFNGEAGYGSNDLGDGPQRQLAGRASWSNDRFGVLAALSHYRNNQITDNREYSYENVGGVLLPEDLDFRTYSLERETNAANLHVEFRPDDATRVFVSTLYSEFIDRETRDQFVFDLGGRPGRGPVTGTVVAVPIQRLLQDGRYNNNTWTTTAGTDFDAAGWQVEARLNYTETESSTILPIPLSILAVPNVSLPTVVYDRADPRLVTVNLLQTRFTPAPTVGAPLPAIPQSGPLAANLSILFGDVLETDAWKLQADASRDILLGGRDTTIEFGAQYDTRSAAGGNPGSNLGALLRPFPASVNIDAFQTDRPWTSDFPRGFDVFLYDNEGIRKAWAEAVGGFNLTIAPDQAISIEEDILAAYAQATVNWGRSTLVAGARVEHSDYTTSGFAVTAAGPQPLSISQSDTRLFPSVNYSFDATEAVKLRAGLTTGVSRPDYRELRASAVVDASNDVVIGGNPRLQAEEAWGVDAAIEWYPNAGGIVALSAFSRWVDNVIFDASTTLADDRFGPGTTGFDYITVDNGSDGRLTGLELNYQQQWTFLPGPLDGFGFQGNITLIDSEFTAPDGRVLPLPGTSDMIYNASLYFENYGLSVRLNYAWRDDWLSSIETDIDADNYWGAYERLDFSARYQVTDFATLYFDANNLTDELGVRYQNRDRSLPTEVEGFGRRFMAGVRVSY
jgi:TonB-dependent receptor